MDICTPTSTQARPLSTLPMPTAWPVLGHLPRIKPFQFHQQLEAWAKELGTPYRLRLGPVDVLVHDDPEVAQAALRDRPDGMSRTKVLGSVMREMGLDGVFSVEGKAWQPQRRLIMGALNASHFRGFYPTLASITERLHRRWQAAADSASVVEMDEDLMRYTVDVTSALSFGEDPNTLDNPGHVIQRHLASIFPMIMKRIVAPIPYWRYLRLPADRALDRDLKVVHAYAHERIARARARMAAEPSETPRNALEAMLAQAEVPGSGFTDDVIVANVLTLLLAGEDTTAHSLAWTMLFLAQRPALQQHMHLLAVQALGPAPGPAVPAGHDAVKLLEPFEGLALEAMRLKPVIGYMAMQALTDKVIGGVAVPKGARYFLITRPAQTAAQNYGCPHDYTPERWAHGSQAVAGAHNPRAFLQFGAGPRVCPGRHLATMEMRLVLAMLLRDFELELDCDPAEITEVLNLTNKPSKMPVRLKRRVAAEA